MFDITIYITILLLFVYSFSLWLDLMFRKIKDETWLFILITLLSVGSVNVSISTIFIQFLLFVSILLLLYVLLSVNYFGGADFKGLFTFYFYFVFLYLKHALMFMSTIKIYLNHTLFISVSTKYLLIELSYFSIFLFLNLLIFYVSKKRKIHKDEIGVRTPFFLGLFALFLSSLL